MTVRSILRKLRTHWLGLAAGRPHRRQSRPAGRARSVVLGLEHLETRLVPAVDTWTGVGTPDLAHGGALDWTDTANWSAGVPNPGDDLVFPAGVSAALTSTFNNFNAGTTFNSITIQGSNYTLAGNQVNLMATAGNPGGGGYVFASANAQNNLISLDLELGGVTGQRQSMTVNAGADLTLSGHLLGPGGVELDKEGTGTLVFTNNNSTFIGPVKVDQGVLRLGDPLALGSGVAATTVQAGAQLQLSNANGGVSKTLILNGTGISNDGALLAVGGSASWGGPVILGSDSTIGVVNGLPAGVTAASESGTTVTITTGFAHGFQVGENVTIAGITPAGYDGTFVVTGVPDATHFTYTATSGLGAAAASSNASATPVGATLNITGQVSDLGSGHDLTKEGLGELILSNANIYRGLTIINNGILTIRNGSALGTAHGTSDGTIVNSTATEKGTLRLQDPAAIGFNVDSELLTLNGPGVSIGSATGITGVNESGTTVTVATGSAHDFQVGESVVIAGITPAGYDGTFAITGVPDATHFTYTAAAGLAPATLGSNPTATPVPLGALEGLDGNNTWGGPITLTGNAAFGAGAGAAVALNVAGTISDSTPGADFALTKVGVGDVQFSGANAYGGPTEVQQGRLLVSNPRALGDTASGTTVDAGAELLVEIDGVDEPLFLNGTGVAGAGALDSANSLNNYTGAITLQSDSSIGVDAGSKLTIQNTITDGGNTFNLTKVGPGPLAFAQGTTYHGTTLVSAGTLQLQNALAVQDSSATQVASGASLQLVGSFTVSGEPLTLTGTGVTAAGALQGASGNSTWDGPVTLSGATALGAGAGASLTITGVMSDGLPAGSVTKVGAGTVVLDAPNAYTGSTAVNAGTLTLADPGAVGGSIKTAVNSGGTLLLANGVTIAGEPLTLTGFGASGNAALDDAGGDATWAGPVTLVSTASVGAAAGTDLTITGVISGPTGNLLMEGPGTVTLNAANTYGGGTTVAAGTLVVDGKIGAVSVQGGVLTGSGQVGAIATFPLATVEPGDSNGFTLTSVGNGSFSFASTLLAQINGTNQGTDYSTLDVTGAFNLGQATLGALFGNGFVPDVGGATFTVLQSTGALTGQFTQGASAVLNGWKFAITYDPNDVTIQRVKADTKTAVILPTTAAQLATQSTLTATVVPANGASGLPTGSVDFMDESDPANPIDLGPATLQLDPVTGLETATLTSTVEALHAGFHHIVAVYDGSDPDFNGSTSAPVTVGGLAVTALAPSAPVAQLSSVTITFNTGVASFPPTSVTVTAPSGQAVALTNAGGSFLPGVSLDDTNPGADTVWELNFPTQTTAGVYTVAVGPNVTDTTGTKMDQNQDHSPGEFGPFPQGDEFVGFLTVGGLQVQSVQLVGSSPATPTAVVDDNGLSSMFLTFNAAVTTFPTSAVALTDPSGNPIRLTASQNPSVSLVTLTDKNPGIDTVWQVTVPTQTAPGNYTLTIGPNIIDRAGNPMPAAFTQKLTVQPLALLVPAVADGLPTSLSSITLTFNEAAQLGIGLSTGDVAVLDPSGNPISGLAVSDLTLGSTNTHDVWQVTLPSAQSVPGTYTLRLGAGLLDGSGRALGSVVTQQFKVGAVTSSSSQTPTTAGPGTTLLNGQVLTNGIAFIPGAVTAVRGGKPGRFQETLTFYNFGSQQLQGLFSLVLAGLPTAGRKGHAGVKVLNRAGISHGVIPGSPYVLTFLSNTQATSFQGATVILHFRASRKRDITFTPLLVVGTP